MIRWVYVKYHERGSLYALNIVASDRIELRNASRVTGNLEAPVIVVDLGTATRFDCVNARGEFVICDQFVDRTQARESTFYDGPQTTHVSAADPFCSDLSEILDAVRVLSAD